MKAAVIEANDFYSQLVAPWQNSVSDIDLSPALSLALNGYDGNQFDAEQLLTGPQTCGVLDYSTGPRACATADLNFSVTRTDPPHDVCLRFFPHLLYPL